MTNLALSLVGIVLVAFCAMPPQVAADNCHIGDANHFDSVCKSCTKITVGSFSVPAKKTLICNLKNGASLTFQGQITFNPSRREGYLMEIMGNNVNVIGAKGHLLKGNGQNIWDGKGLNGGPKETFLYLKGIGSNFQDLKLKNCPARCVAIDGSQNSVFSGFNIDNSEGAENVAKPGKAGHNTDGFDVDKSYHITIKDSTVVNQDDCVAINQASHVVIDNLHCTGSHGFDIATGMYSDYNKNVVENITFSNSVLKNGMFGLHILTCCDGGKGKVNQITYSNIELQGPTDYGIIIQQDFSNAKQASTGHPTGNVPVTNVKYDNVRGYMSGKFSSAIVFRCASGGCQGVNGNKVSITGAKTKNQCNIKPAGFSC